MALLLLLSSLLLHGISQCHSNRQRTIPRLRLLLLLLLLLLCCVVVRSVAACFSASFRLSRARLRPRTRLVACSLALSSTPAECAAALLRCLALRHLVRHDAILVR